MTYSGLPPALVMTMELDPFRDEGEAYARRLAEAGVPVEHTRWDGHFHGSTTWAAVVPEEAAAYHGAIVGALKRSFRIGEPVSTPDGPGRSGACGCSTYPGCGRERSAP